MFLSNPSRMRRWVFLNITIACIPLIVEYLLRLKLGMSTVSLLENASEYIILSFTVNVTTLNELLNLNVKQHAETFQKRSIGAIATLLALFFAWYCLAKQDALLTDRERLKAIAFNPGVPFWPWALGITIVSLCTCYYLVYKMAWAETALITESKGGTQ